MWDFGCGGKSPHPKSPSYILQSSVGVKLVNCLDMRKKDERLEKKKLYGLSSASSSQKR